MSDPLERKLVFGDNEQFNAIKDKEKNDNIFEWVATFEIKPTESTIRFKGDEADTIDEATEIAKDHINDFMSSYSIVEIKSLTKHYPHRKD